MYQTRPDDYDAFRCIAGACPQTCCAAWEIVVDPGAQDAYLRLQHPLAEKLRRVMRVDADGDTYFAQSDGRCPFLCADGLCELQRTLGEQSLCRTCRTCIFSAFYALHRVAESFYDQRQRFDQRDDTACCDGTCTDVFYVSTPDS